MGAVKRLLIAVQQQYNFFKFSETKLYSTTSKMVSIPTDISSRLTLKDGNKIPYFGLGTYNCTPGEVGTAVKSVEYALKSGYRLLDTAQLYKNEKEVGEGIIRSGISREEVYVVTKEWTKENTKDSFLESLMKLGTGYVDLYLIHSPKGGNNLKAYSEMVELQSKGLIRSIGVSNFGINHLEELKKANKPVPAVNQIELHPYCRYEELVDYCRQNGISVMGFCPIARGKFFNDPKLIAIANKHNRTPAQVMLRWSIQNGYITIPKSDKPERIKENSQIFDFSLTEDDMKQMDTFPFRRASSITLDIPWEG